MNTRILIATILIVLGALVHTIAGEIININSLMITDIPTNIKIEIRGAWYLVAIDFFISGFFLIYYQVKGKVIENRNVIEFIALRFIFYGLAFFAVLIFIRPSLLFIVPQWILLLVIGILLGWDIFQKRVV